MHYNKKGNIMGEKKSKRLRQLVKHLMGSGQVEAKDWVVYGREQKYVEIEVPDPTSPTIYDEDGKVITAMRKQLVATGSRMMDPACGRAIYQRMKKNA